MTPKYSIGQIVKIIATGEKVKVIGRTIDGYIIQDLSDDARPWINFSESELKPFCPSRAGVRGNDGRFVCVCKKCGGTFHSKKALEHHMQFENYTSTPEKIEKGSKRCKGCGKIIDPLHFHEHRIGGGCGISPPEKIEKMEEDVQSHWDYQLACTFNKLIDAHYALEERIDKLEKNLNKHNHGLL